jgi:hypothetical protein
MATKIGSGGYFTRTTNLPPVGSMTMAGVFKMLAPGTFGQNIFSVQDVTTNANVYFADGGGGQSVQMNLNGNGVNVVDIFTATLNEWFFLALVINGTAINCYYSPFLSNAISLNSSTASSSTWFTPTRIYFANRPDTFGGFNGIYGYVKLWSAALTQRELELEKQCFAPVRTANLNAFYDFAPETGRRGRDMSGLGNHLTENATLVDVAPPPLPYVRQPFFAVEAPAASSYVPFNVLSNISPNRLGGF